MAKSVSPDAISVILSNPTPDSSADLPELIVQVLDLKAAGNRYTFTVTDGKTKLKAILQSSLASEVINGNIQNLGLIRVVDYTLNDIPNKNEKYLIVTKCEAVSPPLEAEVKIEPKIEGTGIVLKPKQEVVTKSAAQIVNEQNKNMAPSARMAMTRRVHPLASLNPYQGNWTIKVRVTAKGNMRTYKNAKGEGCVFNVELTDEDGTQIQATMFGEAARKFFEVFQMGKVYYISKGTLKVANKQYKTVQNDYEMTLNEYSQVEEAVNEVAFIPETKFSFVPIDQLGPYVNQKELVDVIGVVQSVSPTMSIRRKIDNESVAKRDIVIADDTKKTVVISLWSDLATDLGQRLLDMADESPVVAIKSLRVSDFQGVSLSTVSKSIIEINPETPDSQKLKSWYSTEGKETSMEAVGSGLSPSQPPVWVFLIIMEFKSMEEFWPFYMKQHSKPATRRLHFISTLLSLPILIYALVFNWLFLFIVPFTSYGLAWYSHFYIEKNIPATFDYPLWSLLCDFKMFGFMLTGQMDKELKRLRKRQV